MAIVVTKTLDLAAEKLIAGDLIYLTEESTTPVEVDGFMLNDEDVEVKVRVKGSTVDVTFGRKQIVKTVEEIEGE